MAAIQEGIRLSQDRLIDFGNYEIKDKLKAKLNLNGDEYAVKTHAEITRLEKNGALLIEAVPGAVLLGFYADEDEVSFSAEGKENTHFTLELIPETVYALSVAGKSIGAVKTSLSGKINFGAELSENPVEIAVKKA